MRINARCFSKVQLLVTVLLTCASPAGADYAFTDSTDFALNVLTLPTQGGYTLADAADVGLDIRNVNRGWADSADFSMSEPEPVPSLIDVGVSSTSVQFGESFEVHATIINNGGVGDHGGISISFPELTATSATMPPYDTVQATVTDAGSTFGAVLYADAGDPIDVGGTQGPAQHLLVEGDNPSWTYHQSKTLRLMVTPKQCGTMKIRIRAWICKGGQYGYGPPAFRHPAAPGAGIEQDQQQYWSVVLTIAVRMPNLAPASVFWIKADRLQTQGTTGHGVKIGNVESSGDLPWRNHAALEANLLNGDLVWSTADWHATETAGIMVGHDYCADIEPQDAIPESEYKGVAPGSELLSAEATTAEIDNAVTALASDGCEVINLSIGVDPDNLYVLDINPIIDETIDNNKVTVVAATGDKSLESDDEIAAPAEAYNTIAVGALGASDNGGSEKLGPWNKTSSENIPGPTSGTYYWAERCKPDLVAPGDCTVPTTNPDPHYYIDDGPGSSFSAPHVAGAVALLIEAARSAGAYFVDAENRVDPRVLKSALLTGADKSITVPQEGGRGWITSGPSQPLDYAVGAGGLDVFEAKKVMLGEDADGVIRHMAYDQITWAEQTLSLSLGHIAKRSSLTATLVWNIHPRTELANLV